MANHPPLPTASTATGTRLRVDAPALAAGSGKAVLLTADGEIRELTLTAARQIFESEPVMVCHPVLTAKALGAEPPLRRRGLMDVLDLFAFVKPAQVCVPTTSGIADALGLTRANGLEETALLIHQVAEDLLSRLAQGETFVPEQARDCARSMDAAGWAWGTVITQALKAGTVSNDGPAIYPGFDVWTRLPEWQDTGPSGPPGSSPISEEETAHRLAQLVAAGQNPGTVEDRPEQKAYAREAALAFSPRPRIGQPNIVLAEAGTGTGKTVGYLTPASLWAEKNGPGLWLSTFTKNLQRQIDQELDRLYPDADTKSRKAVIRKGRENYLCLLNFQERVGADPIESGLIARWALASRDGDMVGGDFPAWLSSLFARGNAQNRDLFGVAAVSNRLTDRRGECIYAACPHYRKCFVERAVRKSRRADIVVANHALVMTQAALDAATTSQNQESKTGARPQEEEKRQSGIPTRLVFDEGHHVFDAADSAFSIHLTLLETTELRRWIRGPEDRRRRGRGLSDRIGDLVNGDPHAEELLRTAMRTARVLPSPGWSARLSDRRPQGEAESFFLHLIDHVLARADNARGGYDGLEAEPRPADEDLTATAVQLSDALEQLEQPLTLLARALWRVLEDQAADLESATRGRLDAAAQGLARRGQLLIPAWRSMLRSLSDETQPDFVDWFGTERFAGRLRDAGYHRHWIDPTVPFARTVLSQAHGVLITSATLRDRTTPAEADADDVSWQSAEIRTGASHLPTPAIRRSFASPFDYGNLTRIFVVTDVNRDDPKAVASAYRELFLASDGGGLGLFTAIRRLRLVHEQLAPALETAGLPLYSQHVDPMDVGTLIDIFRAEERSCLLGTDAVRDGVDVPGRALRLIVFDRVPWPRPDILHKARRSHFGGSRYDDMIVRLRLKQAFGRLIRKADDRGVFVILDSRTPTRLTTGLPDTVALQRVGLKEAVAGTRDFLSPGGAIV